MFLALKLTQSALKLTQSALSLAPKISGRVPSLHFIHRMLFLWLVWVSCALAQVFDLTQNEPFVDLSPGGQYETLAHDSLLWGPYRSGNYLGIRPRIPHSLILGLIWFNADSLKGLLSAKHFYEQHHNVAHANWVRFDPRVGGRQVISDNDCHIDITIDFVKSDNGRNWGVRVSAVPHPGHEDVNTSFVWYSGLEGEEKQPEDTAGFLRLEGEYNPLGYTGTMALGGVSKDFALFDIKINDGTGNTHPAVDLLLVPELDPRRTHHFSLRVPDDNVWQLSDIFFTVLQNSIQNLLDTLGDRAREVPPLQGLLARNLDRYAGNVHFVQKMYHGACNFDIVFNEAISPPTEKVTFENIEERVERALDSFNTKFYQKFPLPKMSQSHKEFGKELLSGLLGGLSYQYGNQLVDRESSVDIDDLPVNIDGEIHLPKLQGKPEGPHELFTLVPSRPFFPRGFYWDEGFHLLPLLKYDSDLVLEIFKSWVNLIDDEGWVAREQILGPESRSRVPSEFVAQSPGIFNPPTLMLAFTYLLEQSQLSAEPNAEAPINIDADEISQANLGQIVINNPQMLANYTRLIYPKLKLHYDRFRSSQQGQVKEFGRGDNLEAYRWRGRTTSHSLASGLDDYPRVLPMDIAELNVDLLCWIGVMTRSMKLVAEILEIDEDVATYTETEAKIMENVQKLHWSEDEGCYCDLSVDEDDENILACYKGYISLFPFITRFIPNDDVQKLESILSLIADPEKMWSDYGIRSMSKDDPLYATGENYWRSPIWLNINYLILDNLQHYYRVSGSFMPQELKDKFNATYSGLRKNLITNVKLEWERTGFVWENYNDVTGEARGAKNFLGWSSLVLLIMELPPSLGSEN